MRASGSPIVLFMLPGVLLTVPLVLRIEAIISFVVVFPQLPVIPIEMGLLPRS